MNKSVEEILKERGNTYGDFKKQAKISQALKKILTDTTTNSMWFEPFMSEALEMIMHKIARILNGDPSYQDSWDDIAGYATLVSKELSNKNKDRIPTKPHWGMSHWSDEDGD